MGVGFLVQWGRGCCYTMRPKLNKFEHVSWFMSARHFLCLGCLATVIKLVWGLATGTKQLHLLQNILQMAAPRATIWIPPSNGVSACVAATHARPTQNFYKRDVCHISRLTFGQPQVGTLCGPPH